MVTARQKNRLGVVTAKLLNEESVFAVSAYMEILYLLFCNLGLQSLFV